MKTIILFLLITATTTTTAQKPENMTTKIGRVLVGIDNDKVSIFICKVYKDAKRIEQDFGVPVSLTIAQAAIETGFGKSRLCKEENNYFGIRRNHKNMSYNSKSESFTDYGKVMTQRCYNMQICHDVDCWVDALKVCKYAGIEDYGQKVKSIIKRYKLNLL